MLSFSRLTRALAGAFLAGSFLVLVAASAASAAPGNIGFGFNARDVAGATTGSATLTGGGAFDRGSGFVHAAGGFRCTSDVQQGPLTGCLAGEGVRWDADTLLANSGFKCTSSPNEALKTATTDEHTAVLLADFYRAGDGNNESFSARMFVSDHDLAPDLPGIQNVWIQGLGCATAITHVGS
jgi:hypothetical protein